MRRRDFLNLLGAVGMSSVVPWSRARRAALPAHDALDVLVVGAGVFGVWTAWHLHRAGKRVAVIDAVGPAHSGASSGGESRVTRCGYGAAELYTDWACRSMAEWRAWKQEPRTGGKRSSDRYCRLRALSRGGYAASEPVRSDRREKLDSAGA